MILMNQTQTTQTRVYSDNNTLYTLQKSQVSSPLGSLNKQYRITETVEIINNQFVFRSTDTVSWKSRSRENNFDPLARWGVAVGTG